MTKANRERLYKHYLEVDYKEAAKDMLSKHPELAQSTNYPNAKPKAEGEKPSAKKEKK